MLPFLNRFNLNRTFLEALVTPEELSGLFNASMQAYRGVIERGDFTSTAATMEGAAQFREAVVPVVAFLKECCDVDPEYKCDRTDLYEAFCGWCSQIGNRRLSNRSFYNQLRQHFPDGAEQKTHKERVWTHLALNENGEEALGKFRGW